MHLRFLGPLEALHLHLELFVFVGLLTNLVKSVHLDASMEVLDYLLIAKLALAHRRADSHAVHLGLDLPVAERELDSIRWLD